MNYKQWIIPYLVHYQDYMDFLDSATRRIAELDAQVGLVRASRTDKIVVKGGGDAGDAQIIESLAEREELRWKLMVTRSKIKWVERGLNKMGTQERRILQLFYISPSRDKVQRIMDELHIEKSQVYRLKDDALQHLARVLTGLLVE